MNRSSYIYGAVASLLIHVAFFTFGLRNQLSKPVHYSVNLGIGEVEVQLSKQSVTTQKKLISESAVKTVSKTESALSEEASNRHGSDTITLYSGKGAIKEVQPDYLKNPAPIYPERARLLRQEGIVYVYVEIAKDGSVKDLSLGKSSGFPLLDEAAIKAVRKWKFQPAQQGGEAVESKVSVPISFKINRA